MAPTPTAQPPGDTATWSTGLCDCFSDCSTCCLTYWCPCVTFGRIAEIVSKGSTSCGEGCALYILRACLTGNPWTYSFSYRKKMRNLYKLPNSPCADLFVHCFCEGCALCQEYRELKSLGFDMSLGWKGTNVEKQTQIERQKRAQKQNQGETIAPGAQGGMSR